MTGGLDLRPLRAEDLPRVAEWLREARETGELLGAGDEIGVAELAEALAWSAVEEDVRLWAIVEGEELAGMASWRPDLPWRWVLELELMLASEWRARGHGLQVSRLVIDTLFTTTRAAKMIVRISAANRRALPVIRRLGGREEGRLVRHLRIGGEPVDLLVYGLHREDWERERESRRLLSVSGR